MHALVATDIEGEVSNSRLQLMSASHPVELTKTLQRLVTSDLLVPHGRGRGKTYHLPTQDIVGSASLNVGSSTPHSEANVGSDILHNDLNEGSDLQQTTPALGSAEIERLRQQAYPDGIQQRMGNTEMRQAIVRVCEGRFLTAAQIAHILGRDVNALRDRFLTPMVREGALHALYPRSPRHFQQAYRATYNLFDNTPEPSTEATS